MAGGPCKKDFGPFVHVGRWIAGDVRGFVRCQRTQTEIRRALGHDITCPACLRAIGLDVDTRKDGEG